VEFLVRIAVSMPPDMPSARREAVVAAERVRGRELIVNGNIKAIWRIPGRSENVGIWEAADATELHDLLESLPAFPWIAADVTALAVHPLNRASDSDKDGR
jgi:muconolactone D-isomerase